MLQPKKSFLQGIRPIASESRAFFKYHKLMLQKKGLFLKKMKESQSVFIHIPKTGGKSIVTSLYKIGIHENFGHASAPFYKSVFGTRLFDRFFKFAIVRNPYDRLYSAFRFQKQGGFDLNMDRQLHAEFGHLDFESFVKTWLPNQDIEKYTVFRPQYRFVCDVDNKVMLDQVCYFENLQEEYADLQHRLNFGENLSYINISQNSRSYLEIYDEEMKKIIEDLYRTDLDIFGYTFYGRSSET